MTRNARTTGSQRRLRTRLGAAAVAAGTAGPLLFVANANAATPAAVSSGARALGTASYAAKISVNVLGIENLTGAVAPEYIGCNTRAGVNHSAHVAQANLSTLGTIGAATAGGHTYAGRSVATSSVAGISLFGGELKIGALSSSATAKVVKGKGQAGGTATFVGLTVAGKTYKDNPKPNTTYALPGLGSITLNKQTMNRTANPTAATAAIDIKVTVGANGYNLPVGANVVLGYSWAKVGAPISGLVGGNSYGTQIGPKDNNLVNSNRTFFQPLYCLGTGGKTVSDHAAGFSKLGLTVGAVQDSVSGWNTATRLSVSNSSHVAGVGIGVTLPTGTVNILGVSAVKAAAQAKMVKGKLVLGTAGSEFAGLTVLGKALPAKPAANTSIKIPLVGTLVLNEQTKTKNSITVNMIDLHVSSTLQSVLGTNVVVGSTTARIKK